MNNHRSCYYEFLCHIYMACQKLQFYKIITNYIFWQDYVANLNCRRNRKDMCWFGEGWLVQMKILFQVLYYNYAFYWHFSNKYKYREKRLNSLQKVQRGSSWRIISFNSMIKTLICLCLWKQNILVRNITHIQTMLIVLH